MQSFVAVIDRFIREEDAPTMAEYALLLILTALVSAVAALTLGNNLRDLFEIAAPEIGNPVPPPE